MLSEFHLNKTIYFFKFLGDCNMQPGLKPSNVTFLAQV